MRYQDVAPSIGEIANGSLVSIENGRAAIIPTKTEDPFSTYYQVTRATYGSGTLFTCGGDLYHSVFRLARLRGCYWEGFTFAFGRDFVVNTTRHQIALNRTRSALR